ncbi:D-Ala-D-Ala carboxypeptidase family metallohydrolase [Kordiimonas sp. SCSIO 12610]|uniref:D-Ala-D-Ala carboxypeptidase family metallohydrolase n=1 Tax=Kordiimonas sp. SCSIO 12610 TaxID=2829597 RepID=UPI00210E90B6|nr:D-Ala-D-Ala carboxypeptidase family metallohydrolase [Kordiimonas sp. SCSIO 12610]UTW56207.1 DUF882 domain-containing protein [Kordiimonas sp. SCSIO 12610]
MNFPRFTRFARRSTGADLWADARVLSPHFTLSEFTRSDTANKHGINNHPTELHELENMKALAGSVLEPARQIIGRPLFITSGYRSSALNRIIGGARHSQHMLGEAADFIVKGADMHEIAETLTALDSIPFDQLIFENRYNEGRRNGSQKRGQGGYKWTPNWTPEWTQWVHISHRRMGENRGEVLTTAKQGNKRRIVRGIVAPEMVLSSA